MQHNNEWDRALKITADGRGLIGHAGAVLLRKAADQAGLTAQLSGTMRVKGSSPLLDRGIMLVSMAVALGATSMSDIALLAHLRRGGRRLRGAAAARHGLARPRARHGQGTGAVVRSHRGPVRDKRGRKSRWSRACRP
jgi:hypothetical protein